MSTIYEEMKIKTQEEIEKLTTNLLCDSVINNYVQLFRAITNGLNIFNGLDLVPESSLKKVNSVYNGFINYVKDMNDFKKIKELQNIMSLYDSVSINETEVISQEENIAPVLKNGVRINKIRTQSDGVFDIDDILRSSTHNDDFEDREKIQEIDLPVQIGVIDSGNISSVYVPIVEDIKNDKQFEKVKELDLLVYKENHLETINEMSITEQKTESFIEDIVQVPVQNFVQSVENFTETAQAPVQAPVQASVQAPVQTPVSTQEPVQAPMETFVQASAPTEPVQTVDNFVNDMQNSVENTASVQSPVSINEENSLPVQEEHLLPFEMEDIPGMIVDDNEPDFPDLLEKEPVVQAVVQEEVDPYFELYAKHTHTEEILLANEKHIEEEKKDIIEPEITKDEQGIPKGYKSLDKDFLYGSMIYVDGKPVRHAPYTKEYNDVAVRSGFMTEILSETEEVVVEQPSFVEKVAPTESVAFTGNVGSAVLTGSAKNPSYAGEKTSFEPIKSTENFDPLDSEQHVNPMDIVPPTMDIKTPLSTENISVDVLSTEHFASKDAQMPGFAEESVDMKKNVFAAKNEEQAKLKSIDDIVEKMKHTKETFDEMELSSQMHNKSTLRISSQKIVTEEFL